MQHDVDVGGEPLPELVGEPLLDRAAGAAGGAGAARERVHRLVDGGEDLGDADLLDWPGEAVAAAGTAHRLDDLGAAELHEELFEVGEADLLALGDLAQRDEALRLLPGKVGEGDHRVAPLGAELHRASPAPPSRC